MHTFHAEWLGINRKMISVTGSYILIIANRGIGYETLKGLGHAILGNFV